MLMSFNNANKIDLSTLQLKMDFRVKIKKIHIHLYFIATQYNNALVEDTDN